MLWQAIRAATLEQERLRTFTAPVYVAVGTRSHPGFRATAEALVSLFPRARLEVYEGADHFEIHTQYADRLAASLRALWAQEKISQQQDEPGAGRQVNTGDSRLALVYHFYYTRNMESTEAAAIFAALSQETRLDLLRLLMGESPQRPPSRRHRQPPGCPVFDPVLPPRGAGTRGPHPFHPPRPTDRACRTHGRGAAVARLPHRNLLRRPSRTLRGPGAAAPPCARGEPRDDPRLQRAVSVHPQRGPFDHGRSHPAQMWR